MPIHYLFYIMYAFHAPLNRQYLLDIETHFDKSIRVIRADLLMKINHISAFPAVTCTTPQRQKVQTPDGLPGHFLLRLVFRHEQKVRLSWEMEEV